MDRKELTNELNALGITVENNRIKKNDVKKILARSESTRYLMQILFSVLGNKRYLHDLEELLKSKLVNLTPFEDETIMYLVRDLKNLK